VRDEFALRDSANDLAPSAPISLSHMARVARVVLTFRASDKCFAPED